MSSMSCFNPLQPVLSTVPLSHGDVTSSVKRDKRDILTAQELNLPTTNGAGVTLDITNGYWVPIGSGAWV